VAAIRPAVLAGALTDTCAALAGMGRIASKRVLPGMNHFDAAETLADPDEAIFADVRRLLGL